MRLPILTLGTRTISEFFGLGARLEQTREISFDIGEKAGNVRIGQTLGNELERAGFSRSGCAGE
ncbi:hypothetical protein J2S70_000213 [Trueperella bonasi]|uniref:Uncharacterized protein n=1 Tax=Trueperella bonasi TaxID=312286 RepID=A0ABT9NE22_9ACTO|nr:hypothetical protein [Trueperella bonasi]